MGGIVDAIFGGGGEATTSTTVVNQTPEMTQEEKNLIALNTQLAQRQLQNIDSLQPFQRQLIDASMAELQRSSQERDAVNSILSPEDQARMVKSDFERSQRLGPIQDEILQLQLEQLRNGGKATPEQLAQIKEATDAGIAAGSADIDTQTQRGIGLISDELANSRGLRLTDTPIAREATLLARSGADQKASLVKNLRANEASAKLNFPLAAAGVMSGINTNQQNVLQSAQQFQSELRQRAFQNRLALTGQTSSGGIGLASVGDFGRTALSALGSDRMANSTSTSSGTSYDPSKALSSLGSILQGGGQAYAAYQGLAMFSDRRLKDDFGKVGETSEGIGLHLYKYKGEPKAAPLRLGVMADDVKKIRPGAVFRHSSGFDVVDYGGIGLSVEPST